MSKKLTALFNFICLVQMMYADSWTQKASFGGTARMGACYFSIGNKGYIGTGSDAYPSYHFVNDFWEYDATNNLWSQKANFPGLARYTALSFSVNNKGYIGTGWNQSTPLFNNLWQYDVANNLWSQKGNFPGAARQAAVAITVNNVVYAGLGASSMAILNDFWKYNDTTDMWTQVANFGGAPRQLPFAFSLYNMLYVGCGVTSSSGLGVTNDFWAYDPVTDIWIQKAAFPGSSRYALCYFSINNYGYAGIGKDAGTMFNDFYQYDPIADSWTQKANAPAYVESGFSIGAKGYSGCGLYFPSILTNAFWEYTPDSTTNISDLQFTNYDLQVTPNPAKYFIKVSTGNQQKAHAEKIKIADVAGKIIYASTVTNNETVIDVIHFAKGVYAVNVDDGKHSVMKKFLKE